MQMADRRTGTEAFARYSDGLAEVFSELADLFGNPRSHGLIYGLLFSHPEPLSMDEIADRLGISKGSASQGLRALEELGVVERHSSGRSGTYSAKVQLKILIEGFVRSRLIPRLEANRSKLTELSSALGSMDSEERHEAEWRLKRVAQWHDRAAKFLPIAEKLLNVTRRRSHRGS